jgi:hypothetical protein
MHFICQNTATKAQEIVKTCTTCQMRARPKYKKTNPMQPIRTPKKPFDVVAVDAIGPLEITPSGNRYILTGVDLLTRWPIALAVPDINEITTVQFYQDCLVYQHGVPKYILSDNGANFVSNYTYSYLSFLGCRGIHTSAYRPQSNGLCERANQLLSRTIAKLARDKGNIYSWDKHVQSALLVMRTMINESTKFSPSQLLYGYQLSTPATWQTPIIDYVEGEIENDIADRTRLVTIELKAIRKQARTNSDNAKQKSAINYNKTVHEGVTFQVGDKVLLKDFNPKTKFSDKWIGIFTIIKCNRNKTYYLEGPKAAKIKNAVNGDSLKYFWETKNMIPDVSVTRAQQQFQAWVQTQRK